MGGTIKIAEYIDQINNLDILDTDYWYKLLEKHLEKEKKKTIGKKKKVKTKDFNPL